MLMKHITDPAAFVKTLPVHYSSGNPNGHAPQKVASPLWIACAIVALIVVFAVCALSFA